MLVDFWAGPPYRRRTCSCEAIANSPGMIGLIGLMAFIRYPSRMSSHGGISGSNADIAKLTVNDFT